MFGEAVDWMGRSRAATFADMCVRHRACPPSQLEQLASALLASEQDSARASGQAPPPASLLVRRDVVGTKVGAETQVAKPSVAPTSGDAASRTLKQTITIPLNKAPASKRGLVSVLGSPARRVPGSLRRPGAVRMPLRSATLMRTAVATRRELRAVHDELRREMHDLSKSMHGYVATRVSALLASTHTVQHSPRGTTRYSCAVLFPRPAGALAPETGSPPLSTRVLELEHSTTLNGPALVSVPECAHTRPPVPASSMRTHTTSIATEGARHFAPMRPGDRVVAVNGVAMLVKPLESPADLLNRVYVALCTCACSRRSRWVYQICCYLGEGFRRRCGGAHVVAQW